MEPIEALQRLYNAARLAPLPAATHEEVMRLTHIVEEALLTISTSDPEAPPPEPSGG